MHYPWLKRRTLNKLTPTVLLVVYNVNEEMLPDYLEKKREFKHATITIVKCNEPTLLVTATTTYIPIDQFKSIFNEIGILVAELGIRKLIFDKRQLTVFHQPSMEWYFVEWKAQMFELGLTRHVKILPLDEVFRQSVKIGRNKINEAFPHGRFHNMEIKYAESLEQAIAL